MEIEKRAIELSKEDSLDVKLTRRVDLVLPDSFYGIVTHSKKKSRLFPYDEILIVLDLPDFPVVKVQDTLPFKVMRLDKGRKYLFRMYDIFYKKDSTEPVMQGMCYDRGESFSEVGSTNQTRYYRARNTSAS